MTNILREVVENRKNLLIKKLLMNGAYKKDDKHLFELTLSELEEEYRLIRKIK